MSVSVKKHQSPVMSIDLRGRFVVTGDSFGTIFVWDKRRMKEAMLSVVPRSSSPGISPSSRRRSSASSSVALDHVSPLRRVSFEDMSVTSVSIHPNERDCAISTQNGLFLLSLESAYFSAALSFSDIRDVSQLSRCYSSLHWYQPDRKEWRLFCGGDVGSIDIFATRTSQLYSDEPSPTRLSDAYHISSF